MSEKLKFYKGLEENLANISIELGAIYHCADTGNTYIGVIDLEGEVLEDGTYPLKLDLYSTVSDIYIGDDDEIEGGFELVNADTLGGFPADEYALKSHVYEKIDEINIDSYATKEEVNALTYEDVGAAPAGDYATETFVLNKIADAQLGGGEDTPTIDLSGYATKDDLDTKAPAGYGLGTKCVSIDDWDNATDNGFYYSSVNSPDGERWWGIVIANSNNYIEQRAFRTSGNELQEYHRSKYNGVWQAWENVSPSIFTTKDESNDIMTYAKKVGAPHNLLDNSDFKNPVNQRGSSTYTLGAWGGYCIDRWGTYSNGMTMTLDSNGLTLNGGFFQPISNTDMARYNNKTLTFAAKIEGVIYCCHGVYTQGAGWRSIARIDNPYGYISFENEGNDYLFAIINTSKSAIIEWAALYEGEYTAETLPAYQPKGHTVEEMECRRYYRRKKGANLVGYINGSGKGILFSIENDEPFYKMPTMNIISMSWIRGLKSDGTGLNLTSIPEYTISRYSNNNISPVFSFDTDTNLGFPTYSTVFTYCEYELSADL